MGLGWGGWVELEWGWLGLGLGWGLLSWGGVGLVGVGFVGLIRTSQFEGVVVLKDVVKGRRHSPPQGHGAGQPLPLAVVIT